MVEYTSVVGTEERDNTFVLKNLRFSHLFMYIQKDIYIDTHSHTPS